jgi:hypothetical protein
MRGRAGKRKINSMYEQIVNFRKDSFDLDMSRRLHLSTASHSPSLDVQLSSLSLFLLSLLSPARIVVKMMMFVVFLLRSLDGYRCFGELRNLWIPLGHMTKSLCEVNSLTLSLLTPPSLSLGMSHYLRRRN